MIKKLLSVFLTLGLLVTIAVSVPVCAAETTQNNPYVLYDFEEKSDVGATNNYGTLSFSNDYTSWTEGAGGSKGAVYCSSPKDVCHSVLGYKFTKNPKDLLVGKFKVSFWFKMDAQKTQFKNMSQIKLFFMRGNYEDYVENDWLIPFNSSVANTGEWYYVSQTFEWDGTFPKNGTSILDDADNQGYTFQFRFNGQTTLKNVITDSSTDLSFSVDDFRIERVLEVPKDYSLEHKFDDASAYQTPSEYGTFIFNENTDGNGQTPGWDSLVPGKDSTYALYRKTPKDGTTYKEQLLYYKFTENPKDLLNGKFKISFWFKLDSSVCQMNTSNIPDMKLRLRREVGSQNVRWDIPFDVTKANTGEWMFISAEIEWDGIFTAGGSNINNISDSEIFYFDFFFFSSGTWVPDQLARIVASGDYFAYAIDDFRIEKVIEGEREPIPASCVPSVSGNVIEGHDISISYTWNSGETNKTDGNSIVRVLKENEVNSNQYVVIKDFSNNGSEPMTMEIPKNSAGTKLKVEILPIASDGTVMPYSYSEEIGPIIKGTECKLEPITYNSATRTFTTDASILNHDKSGEAINAVLVLITYTNRHEIIDFEFQPITCANTSDTASATEVAAVYNVSITATETQMTSQEGFYVKAFLWETNTPPGVFNLTMKELAKLQMWQ